MYCMYICWKFLNTEVFSDQSCINACTCVYYNSYISLLAPKKVCTCSARPHAVQDWGCNYCTLYVNVWGRPRLCTCTCIYLVMCLPIIKNMSLFTQQLLPNLECLDLSYNLIETIENIGVSPEQLSSIAIHGYMLCVIYPGASPSHSSGSVTQQDITRPRPTL